MVSTASGINCKWYQPQVVSTANGINCQWYQPQVVSTSLVQELSFGLSLSKLSVYCTPGLLRLFRGLLLSPQTISVISGLSPGLHLFSTFKLCHRSVIHRCFWLLWLVLVHLLSCLLDWSVVFLASLLAYTSSPLSCLLDWSVLFLIGACLELSCCFLVLTLSIVWLGLKSSTGINFFYKGMWWFLLTTWFFPWCFWGHT